MRISNLQFAKGSIVYARFPADVDYLNGRPLIIISDHIPIYDCYWVVKCGSQGKAGINISLFNYATRDFIGGQQVTTIYPYNVYTIKTSQIVSCIGTLDRHIMKKLDEAIDFFRGQSDKVPEFLTDFDQELTGVTYQPAIQSYFRPNEVPGQEYRDKYDARIYPVQGYSGINKWNVPMSVPREPVVDPDKTGDLKASGTVRKVPKKSPARQTLSDNIPEDKIAEFLTLECKFSKELKATIKDLTNAFIAWSGIDVTVIGFSRILNNYLVRTNSPATRTKFGGTAGFSGIGLLSNIKNDEAAPTENPKKAEATTTIKPEPEIPPINPKLFTPRDSDKVRVWAASSRYNQVSFDLPNDASGIQAIDEESAIIILSRQASIGAIQNKFCMSEEDATSLQNAINKAGLFVGNNLISRILKKGLNTSKLSEVDRVCIVLATKVYGMAGAPRLRVKLNQMVQEVCKKHSIDFQETGIWSDIL